MIKAIAQGKAGLIKACVCAVSTPPNHLPTEGLISTYSHLPRGSPPDANQAACAVLSPSGTGQANPAIAPPPWLSHQEQGNAGVAGDGSVVNALSVPRSVHARKRSLGAIHQAAFKTH